MHDTSAPNLSVWSGLAAPPVLFGEQVASAAVFGKSAKRVGGEPEWAWLDDLSDRLEAAHYAVGASDIPASVVGAPHIRQRTFFGAVRLADDERGAAERHGHEMGSAACPDQSGKEERERVRNDAGDGVNSERLADTNGCGQPGQGIMGRSSDPAPEKNRQVDRTVNAGGLCARGGTDHGGWDDVDWLFCRDGKWRPVKSSVQRLADGLPGSVVPCGAHSPLAQSTKEARRVMRLRGYGNAIVPQAAALFIKAFDTTVNN